MASLQERLLPYANGNANMARTYDMESEFESRSISDRMEKKKRDLALNDGPSTPIKLYTDVNQPDGRFLPDSGAGRIKNIRLKKKKV